MNFLDFYFNPTHFHNPFWFHMECETLILFLLRSRNLMDVVKIINMSHKVAIKLTSPRSKWALENSLSTNNISLDHFHQPSCIFLVSFWAKFLCSPDSIAGVSIPQPTFWRWWRSFRQLKKFPRSGRLHAARIVKLASKQVSILLILLVTIHPPTRL